MGKTKVEAARTNRVLQNTLRDPLFTNKAKPHKEPSIMRAEHELRQQGAGEIKLSVQTASSGDKAISNVAENVAIGKQDGRQLV
eukprot:194848-Pleurochrysis_carterae.AAC.1